MLVFFVVQPICFKARAVVGFYHFGIVLEHLVEMRLQSITFLPCSGSKSCDSSAQYGRRFVQNPCLDKMSLGD